MESYRTNEEIIREFCVEHLATRTDWSGTRVETRRGCNSVDAFVKKLMKHIVENNETTKHCVIIPKFKVGDVMRTHQEAADNITDGLPVVVSVGEVFYNCTNELIYIKDQDDYEYPPMNREKNPTTKFNVGDWVVNKFSDVWHIDSFDKKNYQVSNGNKYNYFPISKQNEMRLWSITDAKDGDVLVTPNQNIFIFKKINGTTVYDYCGLYFNVVWKEPSTVNGTRDTELPKDYVPATRKQRNILFARMKEEGYTWNPDEKKLEKIEQKPSQEIVPFEAEHGKYYYCIKDYFSGGKKQASKGDVVQALRGLPIMGLKDASEYFLPVNFIKCNAAWSKEDKRIMKGIESIIRQYKDEGEVICPYYLITIEKALAWIIEKQGEQSICKTPSREIILAIWDLGNEWIELTNGSISTEYGTQLDYIQKHWQESEYYLRAEQGIIDNFS